MAKQVKSKQRVVDHGEVFTAKREVKAMCDLVSQECDRIDSRFLEIKTRYLILCDGLNRDPEAIGKHFLETLARIQSADNR